jgi:hypothetical protein
MQSVIELLIVIGTGFMVLEASWTVVVAIGRATLDNQTNASPITRATMESALYRKFRKNPRGSCCSSQWFSSPSPLWRTVVVGGGVIDWIVKRVVAD